MPGTCQTRKARPNRNCFTGH